MFDKGLHKTLHVTVTMKKIKKQRCGTKLRDFRITAILCPILSNQNSTHKGIKCKLRAGNLCYYSVQTSFSISL